MSAKALLLARYLLTGQVASLSQKIFPVLLPLYFHPLFADCLNRDGMKVPTHFERKLNLFVPICEIRTYLETDSALVLLLYRPLAPVSAGLVTFV